MLNRKGFTLIELLIVVVIIGILAAIAIPKFANMKEKAYVTSMQSDLRNLVTMQEMYFADNMAYSADEAALGLTGSAGVTLGIAITAGPPAGFSATATHPGTARTCAIFVNVIAVPPATEDGSPGCTP